MEAWRIMSPGHYLCQRTTENVAFDGTEFDIISRVTLNREFPSDPEDKIKLARGWGANKEQVVFEKSKPLQL